MSISSEKQRTWRTIELPSSNLLLLSCWVNLTFFVSVSVNEWLAHEMQIHKYNILTRRKDYNHRNILCHIFSLNIAHISWILWSNYSSYYIFNPIMHEGLSVVNETWSVFSLDNPYYSCKVWGPDLVPVPN